MPRLPDVTDFGSRPSLRSNRVDPVSRSGIEVAESVAVAADTFARLAGEHHKKNDRLNYALAKNELLQLDISQRERLKDRDDHEAFDEDYTGGFNSGRDEILGRYALSNPDRALLSAESDLIRERGRVYAGDMARSTRIDQGRAQIAANLDTALEAIQVAPPAQQNELMLAQLENIKAAEERGWYTDVEAQNLIQTFVSGAASDSLESMDADQRIAELELSLSHRRARGAITRDEIAAGEGSGSIADFLHANVAQRMLDAAKKENEVETELATAYAIVDAAEADNPGDAAAIVSAAREASKGQEPGVRARTEQIARQLAQEIRGNRNASRSQLLIDMGAQLQARDDNGDFQTSFDQLSPAALAQLTPGQVAQLQQFAANVRNGQQFARFTNWHSPVIEDDQLVVPSYSAWVEMTPQQKAEVNLESPEWFNNLEQSVWKQLADEQSRIRDGRERSTQERDIQTLDQIIDDVWAGELGLPRTGRTDDEDQMRYLMRSRIASEVDRISDTEFSGQRVPDDRRKEVARRIMGEGIWQRDQGWWGLITHRDGEEPIPIASLDPDDYDQAFVPIQQWRDLPTHIPIGPSGELVEVTWEQRLKRLAEVELDGRVPHQKDLENAYAQILIGGDPAQVSQRVLEALSGDYEH